MHHSLLTAPRIAPRTAFCTKHEAPTRTISQVPRPDLTGRGFAESAIFSPLHAGPFHKTPSMERREILEAMHDTIARSYLDMEIVLEDIVLHSAWFLRHSSHWQHMCRLGLSFSKPVTSCMLQCFAFFCRLHTCTAVRNRMTHACLREKTLSRCPTLPPTALT